MGRQTFRILGALALILTQGAAGAQPFSALARLDADQSRIAAVSEAEGGGITVDLALSQGVPWRVFTLDDPPRAVLDFRELDWSGIDPGTLVHGEAGQGLRFGAYRPGWSRMVIDLGGPFALDRAGLELDADTGRARLRARFRPVPADRFAALSGAPQDAGPWAEAGLSAPAPVPGAEGPLVVVIDAGHGGIDPGAEREGLAEKDLMLTFARELAETLIRAGGVNVVLTRPDDSFVSLERRVEVAHEVGADVFLSLHADALSEGRARGAVVYTLSERATDEASAKLAERHDRDDLLSGVDLSGKDDEVAGVLMDLARMETRPRTDRLADALVDELREAGVPVNSHVRRSAGFSVLKAPDIPSVLIEVGFLSDRRDRENISDPAFRAKVAGVIRDAMAAWMIDDAALAPLVRR